MQIVRFTRSMAPYVVGDMAGFSDGRAGRIIVAGYAVPVEQWGVPAEPDVAESDVDALMHAVPGLSEEQAEALNAAGYRTADDLAAADDDDLVKVPTVGRATVEKIREALGAQEAQDS